MSERRERTPDRSDVDRKSAERLLSGERPTAADGPAAVALDRLLSAAAGGLAVDSQRARDHEARALAAFRAARDAGGAASATRPQDDWRPRTWRRVLLGRRGGRSRTPKVVVGSLAAALALGGVAVAAGNGELPDPFGAGPGEAAPSLTPGGSGASSGEPDGMEQAVPVQPPQSADEGATAGRRSPSSGHAAKHKDKSAAASTKALCQTYAAAKSAPGEQHEKRLNAAWFKRLVKAAGGEGAVDDYCAALGDQRKEAGSAGGPGSSGGADGFPSPAPSLSASGDASDTSDNSDKARNGH